MGIDAELLRGSGTAVPAAHGGTLTLAVGSSTNQP